MKHKILFVIIMFCSFPLFANADQDSEHLQQELQKLQQQTRVLQQKVARLSHEKKHEKTSTKQPLKKIKQPKKARHANKVSQGVYHSSVVSVHTLNSDPASVEYNPAALIADDHVVTYIAGMPIVSSPYLGARPAFDGSDYLVNISSINRDIRLMQQRRRLYRSYEQMGYEKPNLPILTISGKVEPIATIGKPYVGATKGDLSLGSDELDVAAAVNDKVEAYMALAYISAPSNFVAQRVANSSLNLNMGFVNIGDLDESPFYFTAGQLFVPFGRYSTAMISPPLTMLLSRTKTRPVIVGYKSQAETGPFIAGYGYRGDTTLGSTGVGGVNAGYVYDTGVYNGEVGISYISSMNDAGGMQINGAAADPGGNFGGFGSITNGSENVEKVPAIDLHAILAWDRFSLTAEWVTSIGRFRPQDLSFDGRGAQPQALQLEGGLTFMSFDKPSSFNVSGQWSKNALALNLPEWRINATYNISIWKDTVESLEYRHDIDYGLNQYANGAAPPGLVNTNTYGTGHGADTLLAQIGVYF